MPQATGNTAHNAAATSLQAALALHRGGLLEQAEAAYRAIVVAEPGHADALHLLGVVALQRGRGEQAATFIGRALAQRPDFAAAHCNMAGALLTLERVDDALQHLDQAIALDAYVAVAHYNRALALSKLRRWEPALAAVQPALRLQADYADALNLQGVLLLELGRNDAAAASLQCAVAVHPGFAEAHFNLGNARRALALPEAAIASYEQALTLDARYAAALVNLGNTLMDRGEMEAALVRYEQAIEAAPTTVEAWNNRAIVLVNVDRLQDALDSCRQALAVNPRHLGSNVNLGIALRRLGRREESMAAFERALQQQPDHAPTLVARAELHLDMQRPQAALEDVEHALAAAGRKAATLNVLGVVLLALRRPADALAVFNEALPSTTDPALLLANRSTALLNLARPAAALADADAALGIGPRHPQAMNSRASALLDLDRVEESLACTAEVLLLDAQNVPALVNRSFGLAQLRKFDESRALLQQALQVSPRHPLVWANLGALELAQHQAGAALACFDNALTLGGPTATLLANRAGALADLGRLEEAVAAYDDLLQLDDRSPLAAGSRLAARLTLCEWSGFDSDVQRLREAARSGGLDSAPFPLLSIPSTAAEQLQCARSYLAHGVRPKAPLWHGERYEHPRIRVAYLSADLRDHPVAQLMAGVFEAHDRSGFETYAIAFGPDRDDPLRARLRQAFEHFIVLDDRDDQQSAELLRSLEIDIAVDLMGYTRHCRTGIFARRPAPVQVNFLGYPGTLGADFIDYIVADRHVIPPEDVLHYFERVVHLPVTLQPNDSGRQIAGDPGTRVSAGLPDDGFVFCCMNNSYKISPPVFDVWMRLLAAVPNSVLWLSVRGVAADNLRREAQARGIDSNRLVFAARVDSHADYLARYRLADLFLDTLPYNAHTTASDALWAGLPLLTCTGSTFASRVATSLLHAVGLPELVTTDLAQYEALAFDLATHPARLAELRARLAQQRSTHPLFDTDQFRRDLEHAFRQMWLRRQSGLPPAHSWQW